MSDEVDSLHADKHESLLQIDTMILVGMVKHSQSSQNSKFAMSLQYLKKEVRDEVNFLHVNKHQKFPTSWFQHFGINHPTNWFYHYWWAWSSILKVHKVTICNIFKRSYKWVFIFFLPADKHRILTKSHALCVRHRPQHYFSCSHA